MIVAPADLTLEARPHLKQETRQGIKSKHPGSTWKMLPQTNISNQLSTSSMLFVQKCAVVLLLLLRRSRGACICRINQKTVG